MIESQKDPLKFLMKLEIKELFRRKWKSVDQIQNIEADYPGIYLLAWSDSNLNQKGISVDEVFYVGMSNAKAGVKSRLRQFINSANSLKQHSGGMRFYKKFLKEKSYKDFRGSKKLFFIEYLMQCTVVKELRTPADLLIMGKVCLLEMELLAYVKYQTGKEPDLNKK